MITSVNKQGITILTPAAGKWLVKGESYSDTDVYLGKSDLPTNWVEQDAPPPPPPEPIPPDQAAVELPKVQAELDRYKAAVAEATAVSPLALKADLVSALTRLKTATAEIKVAEPIVKEIK